jgi:hypothetical protein
MVTTTLAGTLGGRHRCLSLAGTALRFAPMEEQLAACWLLAVMRERMAWSLKDAVVGALCALSTPSSKSIDTPSERASTLREGETSSAEIAEADINAVAGFCRDRS